VAEPEHFSREGAPEEVLAVGCGRVPQV